MEHAVRFRHLLVLLSLVLCLFLGSCVQPEATAEETTLPDLLGSVFRDIEYKKVHNAPLHLDLYLPNKAVHERAPLVVFTHGGSFVAGEKEDIAFGTDGHTVAALREAGFAVASVQYRLLNGQHIFPYNITDVRDAIRYLVKHADDYALDTGRIATMGTSAGGTLALTAAYLNEDLSPPDTALADVDFSIFAVIDINGPTDLVRSLDENDLNDAFSYYMRITPNIYFGDQEASELAKTVSPVHLASQSSPPTLILHGRQDTVVDVSESINLADKLKAFDVPVELFLIDGAGHGLAPFDNELLDDIIDRQIAFLLEHLPD